MYALECAGEYNRSKLPDSKVSHYVVRVIFAVKGYMMVNAPSSHGERRQLTIVFSDIVGSTELSSQLDPEDWHDIVTQYHQTAASVIKRFNGHVAQYLGDGM